MTDINRVDIPYTASNAPIDAELNRPSKPLSVTRYTGLSAFLMLKLFKKAVEIEVVGADGTLQKICVNKRSLAKQILEAEGVKPKDITEEIKKIAYQTFIPDKAMLSVIELSNNNVEKFVTQVNAIREGITQGVRDEIARNPLNKIRSSILNKNALKTALEQELVRRFPVDDPHFKQTLRDNHYNWKVNLDGSVLIKMPIERFEKIFEETLTPKYKDLYRDCKEKRGWILTLDFADGQVQRSEPYRKALEDFILEQVSKQNIHCLEQREILGKQYMQNLEKGENLDQLPLAIREYLDAAVEREIAAQKKQIDQMVEAAAIQQFSQPSSISD